MNRTVKRPPRLRPGEEKRQREFKKRLKVNVKSKITPKIDHGEINVTDHCLIRYLERVLGMDVETLKKTILTKEVVAVVANGAKKFTSSGVTYRVDNNTIVTCYKKGDP